MRIRRWVTLGLFASALALPSATEAGIISIVTLDTTALVSVPGSSTGPFSLYFQLTDGSGLGNGNNVVTLSDFTFGGGTVASDATSFGGASGDLASTVALTDSAFFSSFSQGFTPGTTLSFLLQTSTEVEPGGTPDALAFSILDWTGFPIATVDPTFADTLFTLNIDSANPSFLRYGTDATRTAIVMSAPDISGVVTPVPEPGTLTLFALGAALVAVRGRRRRRASHSGRAEGCIQG
jgi:PEP-CTERM motif